MSPLIQLRVTQRAARDRMAGRDGIGPLPGLRLDLSMNRLEAIEASFVRAHSVEYRVRLTVSSIPISPTRIAGRSATCVSTRR